MYREVEIGERIRRMRLQRKKTTEEEKYIEGEKGEGQKDKEKIRRKKNLDRTQSEKNSERE
jgi:hypothetical protein